MSTTEQDTKSLSDPGYLSSFLYVKKLKHYSELAISRTAFIYYSEFIFQTFLSVKWYKVHRIVCEEISPL